MIARQGDQPLALPLLAIEPFTKSAEAAQKAAILKKLSNLSTVNVCIFISTNAVDNFSYWLKQTGSHLHADIALYAIGRATQSHLKTNGLESTCTSESASNSEALLALLSQSSLTDKRVLIVRGQGGREYLKEKLTDLGAQVDYLEVYKRQPIDYPKGTLADLFDQGIDNVLLNSGETVQQLLHQAMMEGLIDKALSIPIIVPGKRLYQLAKDMGFTQVVQAENASVQAIQQVLYGNG